MSPLSRPRTVRTAAAFAAAAVAALTLTTATGSGAVRTDPSSAHQVSHTAPAPARSWTLTDGAQAIGAAAAPRTAPRSSKPRTAPKTGGYTLGMSGLIGQTPKGLAVWVDPHTTHHKAIAANAKATVSLWRTLGMNATYRGYGTPKAGEGIITLTEGHAGCVGAPGRVGNTWQSFMPLAGGKYYLSSARVVICPSLYHYQAWQQQATVRHELGHAAGLAHYNNAFAGRTQLMRWQNYPTVDTFQAGDLNGLRKLAAGTAVVKTLIPPAGKFTGSSLTAGNVVLAGSASLAYYPTKAVKIAVTDNGTALPSVTTNGAHQFQVSIPWKGGTHAYCLTAISPVNAAAKVPLGCATWTGTPAWP